MKITNWVPVPAAHDAEDRVQLTWSDGSTSRVATAEKDKIQALWKAFRDGAEIEKP